MKVPDGMYEAAAAAYESRDRHSESISAVIEAVLDLIESRQDRRELQLENEAYFAAQRYYSKAGSPEETDAHNELIDAFRALYAYQTTGGKP